MQNERPDPQRVYSLGALSRHNELKKFNVLLELGVDVWDS